jgi:hypothetical protein
MVAATTKLANMAQDRRTDLEPSANLQNVSQADAAEMLNVNTRTAAAAKVRQRRPLGTDRREADHGFSGGIKAKTGTRLAPTRNQQKSASAQPNAKHLQAID